MLKFKIILVFRYYFYLSVITQIWEVIFDIILPSILIILFIHLFYLLLYFYFILYFIIFDGFDVAIYHTCLDDLYCQELCFIYWIERQCLRKIIMILIILNSSHLQIHFGLLLILIIFLLSLIIHSNLCTCFTCFVIVSYGLEIYNFFVLIGKKMISMIFECAF